VHRKVHLRRPPILQDTRDSPKGCGTEDRESGAQCPVGLRVLQCHLRWVGCCGAPDRRHTIPEHHAEGVEIVPSAGPRAMRMRHGGIRGAAGVSASARGLARPSPWCRHECETHRTTALVIRSRCAGNGSPPVALEPASRRRPDFQSQARRRLPEGDLHPSDRVHSPLCQGRRVRRRGPAAKRIPLGRCLKTTS
jgi:hypothetical protein